MAATAARRSRGGDLTTGDLSQRLGMLERDLRHTWVSLLDISTDQAARLGHAGRLIHQAKTLLDDNTVIA
jgi:hypothetical protein